MSTTRTIGYPEIEQHRTAKSCWVVLHGKVYDLTDFMKEHPGGQKVILKEAGRDATSTFDMFHPKDILTRLLPATAFVGDVDPTSSPTAVAEPAQGEKKAVAVVSSKPPLSALLNAFDFEAVAKVTLKPEAWAYYSSGSDDEITLRENHAAFHRIWLKPRVLVNVKRVDPSTTIHGIPFSIPLYITACALGKLGHPEGEVVLTRAAHTRNIVQMMPTLASCSLDEMMDAAQPSQPLWFQLYVNEDRAVTERIVRHAEERGCKGLFVTVDAPQLGRREKDMRIKFVDDAPDVQQDDDAAGDRVDRSQGAARAISSFIDSSLCWDDVPWLLSMTRMPVFLKGIQTGEDAVRAAEVGVAGFVVSNHGGRQMDTVRSGIEMLGEIIAALQARGLRKKVTVLVDGGFRRGLDLFKAIAMGADGVGMGRPMLYAMSTYGQSGVERFIDLVREELEMVMRLMGTPTIKDIKREMVITKNLDMHVGSVPRDYLSEGVYEPLLTAMVSRSKL